MISIGSMGDVRPYMLLGRELRSRGHEVTIAAFAPFQKMVEEAGLRFYPLTGDIVEFMGRLMKPEAMGVNYLLEVEKVIRDIAPILLGDLMDCVKDAEAMICTFFGSMFYSIAEKYGIPCIQTQYFPMDPCRDMPISSAPFRNLGRSWNELSYRIGYLLISALEKRYLTDWRKENGMAKRKLKTSPDYVSGGQEVPVIYAVSPSLVPRPEEWGGNIRMSGFWWDERPVAYEPDDTLRSFLEKGEKPVYIGFGSMVSGDMEELAQIIRDAVDMAQVRAVVALGWGQQEAPQHTDSLYYAAGAIPHDWLFPRMAAAVHHGGAGTTASSLRAGLPTLIIPFGGDQPFWAERVYKSGCGPKGIPRDKLTTERLAESLAELAGTPTYRAAAAGISMKMKAEHGVRTAADLVEEAVRCWKRPIVEK